MLSVVIKDNGEPNVIKLTYENLWRELKNIPDSELLVNSYWLDALSGVETDYVCLVEADCLVSSGYFSSQIGLFKKSPEFKRMAVMSSSTAINDWANRIYGYCIGNNYTDGVLPIKEKKSTSPYPVQIAYIPGSIIRLPMLKKLLDFLEPNSSWENDLVYFSTQLSLGFWRLGAGGGSKHVSGQSGARVHINPNATYVTTEDYVNDIGKFDPQAGDLVGIFHKESI